MPKQTPKKVNTNSVDASEMSEKVETSVKDEKIQSLEAQVSRALADYANLERRFSEQSSSVIKFATSGLLTKLLEIRDHLAMASVQIKDQSLTMILGAFDKLLVEEGVTEVKTDGPYDPASMECQEQTEGEKDQVIKVIRPGYRLHDRVLRAARVVVGSGVPVGANDHSPASN